MKKDNINTFQTTSKLRMLILTLVFILAGIMFGGGLAIFKTKQFNNDETIQAKEYTYFKTAEHCTLTISGNAVIYATGGSSMPTVYQFRDTYTYMTKTTNADKTKAYLDFFINGPTYSQKYTGDDGYIFSSWNGDGTTWDPYYPTFIRPSYTITIKTDGGGWLYVEESNNEDDFCWVNPEELSPSILRADEVTLTAGVVGVKPYISSNDFKYSAIAKEGYHFYGWLRDSVNDYVITTQSTNYSNKIKITSDETFTAIFLPNTYTVKVTYGTGGKTVAWSDRDKGYDSATAQTYSGSIPYGTTLSFSNSSTNYYHLYKSEYFDLAVLCAPNYKWVGWYSSATGSYLTSAPIINSDVTFTATFEPNRIISYDLAGGTHGTSHPDTWTLNEGFGVSNPTKTGYTFTGWSCDQAAQYNTIQYGINMGSYYNYYTWDGSARTGLQCKVTSWLDTNHSDYILILRANWTPKTYTVTFNKQDGSGGSDSVTATYDSAMPSASAPSRTGYTLQGYYGSTGGGGTKYYNADMSSAHVWDVADNTTIYAYWAPNTYTVNIAAGSGSATNSTYTCTYDEVYYVGDIVGTVTPPTGHSYTGAKVTSGLDTTTAVCGENSYYFPVSVTTSTWVDNKYVKNLTPTENGSVTLTLYYTANTYTVSYSANGGSGAPGNQTKTHGVDLTLSSTVPTKEEESLGTRTVTFDKGEHGTATGATNNKLIVDGTLDYAFSCWDSNGDHTLYHAGDVYKSDVDTTMTAEYMTIISWGFVILPEPTASTGYSFDGWYDNDIKVGDAGETYTPESDITLIAKWTANTYVVVFNKNAACVSHLDSEVTGTMPNQTFTYDEEAKALTANTFALNCYIFIGWSTESDGSGSFYLNGQKVKNLTSSDELNLYAQWELNSYSVVFNKNASSVSHADSEITGTMSNQTFIYDAAEQALTTNTFALTGYTFTGWNTKSNGTGTVYADKASVKNLSTGSDFNLYAQWSPNHYTVTFDKQSGFGGSNSVTATYDAAMPEISYPSMYGYTFSGYFTKTNGEGTQYYDAYGKSVKNWNITKDETLYAYWIAQTFTISYAGNKPSGASSNLTGTPVSAGTARYDSAYVIKSNSWIISGWSFASWNITANGTGTTYNPGEISKDIVNAWFDILANDSDAEIILYAQWQVNTYQVVFNKNAQLVGHADSEVTGEMPNQTFTYDAAEQALTTNTFALTGYTFTGWNTKANGSGTEYADQASVKNLAPSGEFNLYAIWEAKTYQVVFNKNAQLVGHSDSEVTGTMPNQTFTYDAAAKALTTNTFALTGYTFTGWNTQPNGTGTTYADKAQVKNLAPSGEFNLYAIWQANTYQVVFNKNAQLVGHTDSEVTGEMPNQTFTYDAAEQALTTNTFALTGYTFTGWNTKANGTGIAYADKASVRNLAPSGEYNLYAIWEAKTYQVVFNKNAQLVGHADSEVTGEMPNQTFTYDAAAKALTTNTFALTGYTFTGWNTQSNGSGTAYADKAQVKNLAPSGEFYLYAIWEAKTYQVVFNKNAQLVSHADSEVTGEMPNQIFTYDAAEQALTVNTFALTGYTFTGWNTQPNGNGTTYPDQASVKNLAPNGEFNLYAIWQANTYQVVFNKNAQLVGHADSEVTGEMPNQTFTYDAAAKALTTNTFALTGYTFTGWNTQPNGNGTTYADKAQVKNLAPSGEFNLYAIWGAKTYQVVFNKNAQLIGHTDSEVTGTMPNQTFTYDAAEQSLTVNTFALTGYTFTGWNSQPNGTGTTYPDQASVKNLAPSGEFNLYAIWQANTYQVVFNKNAQLVGHLDSEVTGEMPNQTFTYDAAEQALTVNTFTLTGYTFTGWNTKANGTGTEYADKAQVKNLAPNGEFNLYAIWQANTYQVVFNKNAQLVGHTDSEVTGEMPNQILTYDAAEQALTTNTFALTGYTFTGWNTQPNGNGTTYPDQASVKNLAPSGEFNLYAIWQANTYQVVFNKNAQLVGHTDSEVTGTMLNQTFTYDATEKALTENAYFLFGYTFTGWNTKANGTGIAYADKASVRNLAPSGEFNLYAIWQANEYLIKFAPNNGVGSMADQIAVYDNSLTLKSNEFTRTDFVFAGWALTVSHKIVHVNSETLSVETINQYYNNGEGTTLVAIWAKVVVVYNNETLYYETLSEPIEYVNALTDPVTSIEVDIYGKTDENVIISQNIDLRGIGEVKLGGQINNNAIINMFDLNLSKYYGEIGSKLYLRSGNVENVSIFNNTSQNIITEFVGFGGVVSKLNATGQSSKIILNDDVLIEDAKINQNTRIFIEGNLNNISNVTIENVQYYNSAENFILKISDTVNEIDALAKVNISEISGYALKFNDEARVLHFDANEYTITFDKQDGIGGTDSIKVKFDAVLPQIELPNKVGYTFDGYYFQSGGNGQRYYTNAGTSSLIYKHTEDIILFANWVQNVLNKSFSSIITTTMYMSGYSNVIDNIEVITFTDITPDDVIMNVGNSGAITIGANNINGMSSYSNSSVKAYLSLIETGKYICYIYAPNKVFLPSDSSSLFSNFVNLKSFVADSAEIIDTTEVENMAEMFYGLEYLTFVNVSGFDTTGVNNIDDMFNYCENLQEIFTPNSTGAAIALSNKYTLIEADGDIIEEIPQNLSQSLHLGKVYELTLGQDDADEIGTQKVNVVYNSSKFIDDSANAIIISNPKRVGYIFAGWQYNNVLIIDNDGKLVSVASDYVDQNGNWIGSSDLSLSPVWNSIQVKLSNTNITKVFDVTEQITNITEATEGSGYFEYSIIAGNSEHFSLNNLELAINASTPVGVYVMTIEVLDSVTSLTAQATLTVTIEKAKVAIINSPEDKVYTGSQQAHGIEIPFGVNIVSGDEIGIDAETYSLLIGLDNNHIWSDGTIENKTVVWKIGKKQVVANWNNLSLTYNGLAQNPVIESANTEIETENLTFTYSVLANEGSNLTSNTAVNVGSYKVTATPTVVGGREKLSNYDITNLTIDFEIVQKTVTLSLSKDVTSIKYGDSETINVIYEGDGAISAVSLDNSRVEVSVQNSKLTLTVKDYIDDSVQVEVKALAGHNYDETETKTLTVNMLKRDITITAKDQVITFGEEIKQGANYVEISGDNLVNGDSLSSVVLTQSTVNFTTDGIITPSAAKIFKASAEITEYYNIAYQTGNLQINSKFIAVPNIVGTYEYNATMQKVQLDFNFDEKIIGLSGNEQINVGTYEVTLNLLNAQNYSWADGSKDSKVLAWTINKKAIVIKAIDQDVVFGEKANSSPAFANVQALAGTDKLSSIKLILGEQLTANTTSIIASEAVIFNQIDEDVTNNYEITYQNGIATYIQNKLSTPTSLSWSGLATATWVAPNEIAGINISYVVNLYRNSSSVYKAQVVSATMLDLTDAIRENGAGEYTFGVFATSSDNSLCANSDEEVVLAKVYASNVQVVLDNGVASATINNSNNYVIIANELNVKVNAIAKVGYEFNSWLSDDLAITNKNTVETYVALTEQLSKNIQLKATSTAKTFTISFNSNGGAGGIESIIATFDSEFTLPANNDAITNSGYDFVGWALTGDGSKVFEDNDTLSIQNVNSLFNDGNGAELFAVWEEKTYTIKFQSNGGSACDDIIKKFGEDISLPIPEFAGHNFVHWYDSNEPNANKIEWQTVPALDADEITLFASWENRTYTIIFETFGGNQIENMIVKFEDFIVLPKAQKTGYDFAGWYDADPSDASASKAEWISVPAFDNDETTLYAAWTPAQGTKYVVNHWKLNVNGTGYTCADKEELFGTTGEEVTPSVKEYVGFTSPVPQTKTITADGKMVVDYHYSRNSYSYTINSAKGVDISNSTQTGDVLFEELVKLNAIVANGYKLVGWSNGLVGENVEFNMPAENVEITPIVELVEYKITYNLQGGEVDALPETYTVESEAMTLGSPAKEGYIFDGWTGSNGTNPELVVTIPAGTFGDLEYTANYTPNSVSYSVKHYKMNEDGTYAQPEIEVIPSFVGEVVTPETKNYEGYVSPAPQTVTVDANGQSVVEYYYDKIICKVIWNNHDGTEIYAEDLYYGSYPIFNHEIPQKASDDKFDYEFKEWSPSLAVVTDNITYTATFNSIIKKFDYVVNIVSNVVNVPNLQLTLSNSVKTIKATQTQQKFEIEYGTTVTPYVELISNGYKYNLSWSEEKVSAKNLNAIVGNATKVIKNEQITIYVTEIFTVSAKVNDEKMGYISSLQTSSFLCGTESTFEFEAGENNGYKFVNWSSAQNSFEIDSANSKNTTIKNVVSDDEIVANFDFITYIITLDISGEKSTILYTIESDDFVLPAPEVESKEFVGWTTDGDNEPKAEIKISKGSMGDKSYHAVFKIKGSSNSPIILIAAIASFALITSIIIIVVVIKKKKRKKSRVIVNTNIK